MSRNKRIPNTSTYPGRVASRLTELRLKAGWSIEDVKARLSAMGVEIPASTLYAYERGKDGGGADLPLSLVPTFAKLFGYAAANGWLPSE